jgi:hypothetical protein
MLSVDLISPVPFTSRGIQKNYDNLRVEAARHLSSRNWPVTFIDTAALAAAGL